MILICYGITKSGSTLAFELAKGVLSAAGHEQTQLADGLVEPGRRINFINRITPERLNPLMEAVPGDKVIAVKTHAGFKRSMLPYLDQKVEEGKLKVHAAYRDPREICLSLVDAGERARAKGKQAFADVQTLDTASENVSKQLTSFLRWASVKNALRLNYNSTAFDMDNAVARMAEHLGVEVDAPAVGAAVTGGAFTQKNKAVKDRYKDDLTVRQNEKLYEYFKNFIDHACTEQDEAWFEKRRERMLKDAGQDEEAA